MELVQRLRDWPAAPAPGCDGMSSTYVGGLTREAADEIERLRAENEKTWRNLAYSENDRERLSAALKEISDLRCEDMPVADGECVDNLAALYALRALEQKGPQ